MSESAKALLGGVIVLSAIGILIVWFGGDIPSNATVWTLRLLLPVIIVATSVVLCRAMWRKDVAPDFIRQFFGKPFERDGVCFSILPAARNGNAYFDIVFSKPILLPLQVPCRHISACKVLQA
jgi:hypothetical protein